MNKKQVLDIIAYMSTEQHLIENVLFYYRKHKDFDFDSDPLIKEQRELYQVRLDVLQEFVVYIYYNVLDTEEARCEFFHDRVISQEDAKHLN